MRHHLNNRWRMFNLARDVLRVVLFLMLFMISSNAFSANQAQSVYQLRKTPEYILLSLYDNDLILGYTRSFWTKGDIAVIVGRKIEAEIIYLSFYRTEVLTEARNLIVNKRAEVEEKIGQIDSLCYTNIGLLGKDCSTEAMIKLISLLPFSPIESDTYAYSPGRHLVNFNGKPRTVEGEWKATHHADDKIYSEFLFLGDFNLQSADRRIRGLPAYKTEFEVLSGKKTELHFEIKEEFPLDNLIGYIFEYHIVRFIAGLPAAHIEFKHKYCNKIEASLESVLSKAGNWSVEVTPERDQEVRVTLKSHSDREFFDKDGYWWKAFVEIRFSKEAKEDQECSGASVQLYDSVVCTSPVGDDPDKGRSGCFHRLDYSSKAEFQLQDRLGLILRQAYSQPDK